jgi:DegV family protein with EDD domain
MLAAEAAMEGMSADEVQALLEEAIPQTRVFGVADDLKYAVKGGRVPASVKKVADLLHVNPVLTANKEGKVGLSGMHWGRGANPVRLARTMLGKMKPGTMYRVLISHADNPEGARHLRQHVLNHHARIHSCHITDAGPALGAHFGPGGLIAAFTLHPDVLK